MNGLRKEESASSSNLREVGAFASCVFSGVLGVSIYEQVMEVCA